MATPQTVAVPMSATGGAENCVSQTITTGSSGAEIVIGNRTQFMITAFAQATGTTTNNINIKFGAAGLGAATVADFGLPISGPTFSVSPAVFETGDEFSSIRIFNNSTASVVVYVMKLNRAG
jgi:hypothetical protein